MSTRDINVLLGQVAARGASPRTANKHRQLICAIYSYGCQEATFSLAHDPATAADRRPEPERTRLDFRLPEEVEALARALTSGLYRGPDAPAVSEEEAIARADEDRQDAELVRVAAYTGLRRGELVALRWREVDFIRRKLVVRRAVSANVETSSTKYAPSPRGSAPRLGSRRTRSARAARRVHRPRRVRLRQSPRSAPRRLRPRRRVERARETAGLRPLRFHDLRHTYGSLLVAGGVHLASVKAAMGHSRITTTERYLHARSASEMADRFTAALSTGQPGQAELETSARRS